LPHPDKVKNPNQFIFEFMCTEWHYTARHIGRNRAAPHWLPPERGTVCRQYSRQRLVHWKLSNAVWKHVFFQGTRRQL